MNIRTKRWHLHTHSTFLRILLSCHLLERLRTSAHFSFEFAVYYIVTYSGVLFTMELYCTPKNQHTTVEHNQQLFEHTYTSNRYGLGTLTQIEFFQHDLLWQSLPFLQSESFQTHVGTIHRRAIGSLAHHNSTSTYSPSLTCTSPDDRLSSPSTV
jgi:hypothetical protein